MKRKYNAAQYVCQLASIDAIVLYTSLKDASKTMEEWPNVVFRECDHFNQSAIPFYIGRRGGDRG